MSEPTFPRARAFAEKLTELCQEASIEVYAQGDRLFLKVILPDGEDHVPLAHGADGYKAASSLAGWRNWKWLYENESSSKE